MKRFASPSLSQEARSPSVMRLAQIGVVIGALLHAFDLLLLGGLWQGLGALEQHPLALLTLPLIAAVGLVLAASAYLIDDATSSGTALAAALLNGSWLVVFALLGVAMGRHLTA